MILDTLLNETSLAQDVDARARKMWDLTERYMRLCAEHSDWQVMCSILDTSLFHVMFPAHCQETTKLHCLEKGIAFFFPETHLQDKLWQDKLEPARNLCLQLLRAAQYSNNLPSVCKNLNWKLQWEHVISALPTNFMKIFIHQKWSAPSLSTCCSSRHVEKLEDAEDNVHVHLLSEKEEVDVLGFNFYPTYTFHLVYKGFSNV